MSQKDRFGNEEMPETKAPVPIALWNPLWTIIWSFIFSPAFGAFLQRANWNEMGDIDSAQMSGKWFYYSLATLGLLLIAEPFFPEDAPFGQYWFYIIWTIWYVIWILVNGTKQVKAVNAKYGQNYHHKLWGRPITIGVCGLVLWLTISMTYVIGLVLLGVIVITG